MKAMTEITGIRMTRATITPFLRARWDWLLLAALLVAGNVGLLLTGDANSAWFFGHDEAGLFSLTWLLHPFAHVSVYHLLLDSAAFALLYAALSGHPPRRRLLYVAAGGIGGALAACVGAPGLAQTGLGGLSGVAHGLFGILCLDRLRATELPRTGRLLAALMLLGLLAKCLLEAVSGQVALAAWHPGGIGSPVAIAHAGGLLGACLISPGYTSDGLGFRRQGGTTRRRQSPAVLI